MGTKRNKTEKQTGRITNTKNTDVNGQRSNGEKQRDKGENEA